MKSTWQQRWNRLFPRRHRRSRPTRLPRMTYGHFPRNGAFARPRLGRFGINLYGKRWLWRVVWGAVAISAIWVLWQSWVGLGVFDN